MRNALRSFRASIEIRGEIYLPALPIPFGDANAVTSILGVVPEALGASLELPGHPLFVHPSVPRSTLGRHLGVQKPFRKRPEASTKRFWTPGTAQDRLFVDFGTIWHGFPSISDQFFVDFRSNRLRRSHRIGGSKKTRVILAARLAPCGVQSLRAARVSFDMAFEPCMFSIFFVAYPQAHLARYTKKTGDLGKTTAA